MEELGDHRGHRAYDLFLYGINDTWTKDATAFAIFTVGILAYTLVTLYSDVEML